MSVLSRKLFAAAATASYLTLLFAIWPAPIDAVAFHPAPDTRTQEAAWVGAHSLGDAVPLGPGVFRGPEDVVVDADGRGLFAGSRDGRLVHWSASAPDAVETVTDCLHHPLGLDRAPDGSILVCDAYDGLVRVGIEGAQRGACAPLTNAAEDVPFKFTDDVDVAADGTVYFSDASFKFDQPAYALDIVETRGNGRLLKYEPATETTTVLARDLTFANGVALAPDESFVLVNETSTYRVARHWLKGSKAGTTEPFIENLPGMPDGISTSPRGTFWVALFTVRKPLLDAIHPHPWLKNLFAKLPPWLRPKPIRFGAVVELNAQGEIVRAFTDPSGEHVREVTSVEEHDGHLYLGTLKRDVVFKVALP